MTVNDTQNNLTPATPESAKDKADLLEVHDLKWFEEYAKCIMRPLTAEEWNELAALLHEINSSREPNKDAGGNSVKWLPGWYASRLHALPATVPIGANRTDTAKAVCGAHVYLKAATGYAQRRMDRGVPHCKHCERALTPDAKAGTPERRSTKTDREMTLCPSCERALHTCTCDT